MVGTSDAKWAIAVLVGVGGVALGLIGVYELLKSRPGAGGAHAAQPAGISMRSDDLAFGTAL
jgi:hypothetical protein